MLDIIDDLSPEKLSVRIENLNLPIRAYNSLRRADIRYVWEILDLGERGVLKIRRLGKVQLDAIFDALAEYLGVSRDELAKPSTSSAETEYVPDKIAELPVSILNLSSRAANSLNRAEINTIRELLKLRADGLSRIRGIGEKTSGEIESKLSSFLERSAYCTDEEIEKLRDSRPYLVTVAPVSPPNLVGLITKLSRELLCALNHKRDFEVLKRRYGLEGSNSYTLQEIGYYYDLTRERVRQIESRGKKTIKNYLMGQVQSRDWRIPESVVNETLDLLGTLRSGDELLTEREISEIIESRYDVKLSDTNVPALRFLLHILGFRPLPTSIPGPSHIECCPAWLMSRELDKKSIYAAIKSVYKVLREAILPLPMFEITARVNRRRKNRVSTEYIQFALKVCVEVEITAKACFQVKLESLPSLADKAYRILHENGAPLDVRVLLRTINHNLVKAGFPPVKRGSLVGQLAIDPRFEPIGRSGKWCLSEWGHVSRETILEVMEEFFHLEQRYASADDVFIYVQSKRPDVSKHSVVSYLSQKEGIFVKVSKTEYGLTAWGGKPQFSKRKRRSHREIMKRLESAIPAVFADYEVDVLALSKLVHELEKRTDLKSVTIYTALPRLNLVELETHPKYARRKVAKYVGRLTTVEKRPRKTIREAVQEEVEKFLRKQPDHRALVSDIASQVTETVKCARHTFYSYLSGMQTVHKERVDGRLYCRLVTDKSYPLLTFPRLEEVEDESLKSNVQRAIRSLNVENVDLGLFQLGKILERELKDFLLEARRRHVFPVTNNDLQKFVSMIDCVERNGIVRNKHHLTLLRQERNERAHGAILNLKEREELMRQAPFLAGLFIEYITLFHKKRSRLCGTATS